MADYSYTWEKFYSALLGMAQNRAHVKARIAEAFIAHLSVLDESDIPDEVRMKFIEIRARITNGAPGGDEAHIQASAKAMTDQEAREISRTIVYIYDHLGKYRDKGQRALEIGYPAHSKRILKVGRDFRQ